MDGYDGGILNAATVQNFLLNRDYVIAAFLATNDDGLRYGDELKLRILGSLDMFLNVAQVEFICPSGRMFTVYSQAFWKFHFPTTTRKLVAIRTQQQNRLARGFLVKLCNEYSAEPHNDCRSCKTPTVISIGIAKEILNLHKSCSYHGIATSITVIKPHSHFTDAGDKNNINPNRSLVPSQEIRKPNNELVVVDRKEMNQIKNNGGWLYRFHEVRKIIAWVRRSSRKKSDK
ncbi:hypothetical protein BJX70DRAFT_286531 [Aspergillus crustosus]